MVSALQWLASPFEILRLFNWQWQYHLLSFFIEPSQIPKKLRAFPLSKDTTGGRGGGSQTLKPHNKMVSWNENGTLQKYQKGNLSLFKETPRQSNVTFK